MKNGMIAGLLIACIGFGMHLISQKQPDPTPVATLDSPAAPAAPASPSSPAVLGQVIEVTDIDPLLDPPAKPITGTPFDTDPEAVRVSAPSAPDRIPPAVD